MVALLAVGFVLGAQSLLEAIDLPVLVLGKGIVVGMILEFPNNPDEAVSVRLGLAFACRQRERFQLEEGGVENIGASRFILIECFLGECCDTMVLDLVSRVVFAAGSYHDADFLLRSGPCCKFRLGHSRYCRGSGMVPDSSDSSTGFTHDWSSHFGFFRHV